MAFEDRESFVLAHQAWEAGDFDGFMSYIHPDIHYTVNVDGQKVPYAMSSLGKDDAADRLGLLVATFAVERFVVEQMVHEIDHSWSRVHGVYRHRATGEVLDTKLRFRGWMKDGLIVRLEELLDARYIEAFERFVFFMQQAATGREC